MRMLIGLILFWISTFGYLFIFKKKTKIPYELLLPILFSLIGIIIFLAGIFNMLKEFSVLICFGGIFFFAYNFLKKEINFNEIKSTKFILLMLAALATPEELLPSIIVTAIIIGAIYGVYFLATYLGSRNIIKEEE